MPDKASVPLTFQQTREQCEQGRPEAWQGFVRLYGPPCARLLELYSPVPNRSAQILEKTIGLLTANDFERLRSSSRDSEREFLVDLRALLLDTTLEVSEADQQDSTASAPSGPLTLEAISALLSDLPLLQQEMMFSRLAGYTDATIEVMMRLAPKVAHAAFARLDAEYSAVQRLEKDGCPWPLPWLALLREARTKKKESCPPLHQFLRIHDGQVSWYDKEPAEAHVASCLYCLERWTALREVGYWRRVADPLPNSRMQELLRAIPVAQSSQKKSLLQRVFGQGR